MTRRPRLTAVALLLADSPLVLVRSQGCLSLDPSGGTGGRAGTPK